MSNKNVVVRFELHVDGMPHWRGRVLYLDEDVLRDNDACFAEREYLLCQQLRLVMGEYYCDPWGDLNWSDI